MALLEIRKLTKQFGGLVAVDCVNFYLDEKEILGLIGPNGAGKTTIFNMITGIYPPTTGEIHFHDQRIAHPTLTWRKRLSLPPGGRAGSPSRRCKPSGMTSGRFAPTRSRNGASPALSRPSGCSTTSPRWRT